MKRGIKGSCCGHSVDFHMSGWGCDICRCERWEPPAPEPATRPTQTEALAGVHKPGPPVVARDERSDDE